ncbi:MAG TPA: hypothetical protein VIK04_19235 [Solirubrobacteraceae bacterium]
MTPTDAARPFDPRAILAALQAAGVTSVLIGGLARVARGADEITSGVDVCPSLQPPNLLRLGTALGQLQATRVDGPDFVLDPERLRAATVVTLSTMFGELKLIAAPAGVPRGYDALKAGASTEHLGGGLRPEIASTGDLIAMAAALRREQDLQHIPALRRILELEADPAAIVTPPVGVQQPHPGQPPGPTLSGELSYLDRTRSGPGTGTDLGR